MAWSSVGSLGGASGSATANQSSVVLTTTASAAVGTLVVFCVACDNNASLDGDEGAVSSVSDSAGNTWTKAAEFTNGQGAPQAGATVSVWFSVLVATLGIGATITANLTNNTSRDATAWSAWNFAFANGSTISVAASNTLADDAADPGSVNATTVNREHLRFRAIGSESNSLTALTVTAGWTAITGARSSSGTATSNMTIRGEFHISSGTGDASNPTYVSADHASVYVAFSENPPTKAITYDWPVPKGATFPSDLRGFLSNYDPNLLGQPPYIARQPVFLNLVPEKRASELSNWTYRNARPLITPPTPFVPIDFPNPQAPLRSVELLTHLRSARQVAPATVNIRNYDWPNPFVRAPLSAPLHFRSPNAPAVVPFTYTDWPVPRGAPRPEGPLHLRPQPPPMATPFAIYDWPNPIPRPPPQNENLTFSGDLLDAPVPFNMQEWPNPRGAEFASHLRTFVMSVPPPTPGIPPRRLYDWPVPRGPEHPNGLRIAVFFYSPPVPGSPFFPIDYPNPRGPEYPVTLRTFANWYPPVPPPLPIHLRDWPVPRAPEFPTELRTFVRSTPALQSLPPQTFDFPNPRAPEFPVILRTHTVSSRPTVPPPTVYPLDWPVPRGPEHPVELRTFLDFFDPPPGQNPVIRFYDWPVPKAPEFPLDLRTFISFPLPPQPASPPTPLRLYDWPVPRGPEYATSLRTFSGSIIAPLTVPIPAAPKYETDWQNPIRPPPVNPSSSWASAGNVISSVLGSLGAFPDWLMMYRRRGRR